MTEDTPGVGVEISPDNSETDIATDGSNSHQEPPHSFPLIGIGASAGGLESIEQFFRDLDDQVNAAFVVIQHLSPDFKSFMPEILSKKTRLETLTATDGMPLRPNCIYLMPPRMNMVVKNYTLHLSNIERTRIPNKPIDLFFTSLARDAGKAATAVVLSGTGSDGAFGIKEVHRAGGQVYVESMVSAKFDGMPSAAIATGVVTSEGTPRQIAAEIFGLAFDDGKQSITILKKELMGSRERVQIFNAIESRYGVDFARYKIATVNRRIDRRMSELHLGGIEQYWQYIQDHPQEVTTLYYEMLIGVTDFFRDSEAFDEIRREISRIVEVKEEGDEIRLWSAGCASGEEIYSLGMLFLEEMKSHDKQLNLKIFATDIDDEILGRAATGIYQEEQMTSIPAELRRTYFTQQSGAWKVVPSLRSRVVFARHNVMHDPPFTKLDMIVCRNLLIYLDNETQKQVLSLFYFSLNPNGVLFLGPSESLGKYESGYDTIHTKWKIFSKSSQSLPSTEIGGAPAVQREFPIVANPLRASSQSRGSISRANSDDAYQALLEQFVPPSLLIDENQNLIHVYGELPLQLSFKSGRVSNSLRSFLDENLCTAISVCVQRAKRDRSPVEYTRFKMRGDSNRLLDFKVTPVLPRGREHVSFFLVSLNYRDSQALNRISQDAVVDDKSLDLEQVSVLEEELQNTKEHLQATIEELETTNEELQSTNEELLASNEQLQSTNEELHSVNEELHTVNSEYQAKITELNQLSIDEEHLFSNTGVGMIFVDQNLRIRKFTPAAAELFSLLTQDLGRPFEHLTHEFIDVDFLALINASLSEQQKVEHELRTKDDDPYIAQILPYHNSQGAEDGVVLSFVSIRAIREAERLYQRIVQDSPIGVVGLNEDHRIVSVNESLLHLLGYDADTLEHQAFSLLLANDDGHPLRAALSQLRNSDGNEFRFKNIACDIKHRTGRDVHVDVSIRQLPTPDGLITHLYVMDTTERQEYLTALETHRDTLEKQVLSRTAELAKRNEEYEDLYENAPDMHASVDAKTSQIIQCNQRMVAMTGYPKVELLGKEVFELYSEDSREEARAAFNEFVRSGTVRSRELIILTRSGERIPVLLNVEAVRNDDGEIVRSRSTWTDVSDVYYLQRENTTFLLATQGSEIGIWDWDLQTGDQVWSAKFYELLGYVDATAPVLDFHSDIAHPNDKPQLEQCFEAHINGSKPSIDIHVRLRTNTSGYRWFRLQGRAARDGTDKAIRIVGSARDVHDAVTAQVELKRQADVLTFITEQTNDGWWDWSVQTDYEYMSDRFWHTFGVDPDTMPSSPSAWQNLIHPEDLERTLDNFNKHVATRGAHPYFQEVRYRHADGHWVTVLCRGQVIEWDDKDQPVRMIGVHTDVTRLKEQEARLESVNKELSFSNEELERFAYIASHDLKAPLRGISNLVEFLREDMEPLLESDQEAAAKVDEHIERLTRQTQRMQGLIRGVLEYSRLDGIEPSSVSVDVGQMLGDIAADHQLVVGEDLLLPDDLPTIMTDRVKLEQVFGNLISNAAKFHPAPEELKIIIRCQREGSWLTFSVADNGDGIDARYHERIFDMFQTLHTRDKFESTGVGLTMVKRIVGQFGGTVNVESIVGEGAKFSFTWPLSIETLQ